jgi:hypothetical protein
MSTNNGQIKGQNISLRNCGLFVIKIVWTLDIFYKHYYSEKYVMMFNVN